MKNRFGPVDEVGCFDLSGEGIVAVTDPTGLFVARHHAAGPRHLHHGDAGGPAADAGGDPGAGGRPTAERPRRTTSGVDNARASMLVAVLQQRGRLRLDGKDVFVSTVGGARITEPAGDLAMALAMASAARQIALPGDIVAIGEIGLAGELRRVRDLPRRLAEAARLGFRVRSCRPRRARPGRGREIAGCRSSRSPTWPTRCRPGPAGPQAPHRLAEPQQPRGPRPAPDGPGLEADAVGSRTGGRSRGEIRVRRPAVP